MIKSNGNVGRKVMNSDNKAYPFAPIWILLSLVALCGYNPPLDGCTTFCFEHDGKLVFGRNYDWQFGTGMVIVNKRDILKTAFLVAPPTKPVEWVSKYGSISFNQYGRELPMGGINEAGLVVEQMWMSATQYPDADQRPGLRELTWIQYQLDTAKSVDEVITADSRIRIVAESVPLHFLVCDRKGQVAAIEFLQGKMVVHRGKNLPVTVLANSPFSESMEYVKKFQGFGGDQPMTDSRDSLDRFARAAQGIKPDRVSKNTEILDHAFKILDDVSQGPATQWSIVYDVRNETLQFKTSQSPAIKTLKLKAFDFSGTTPCRILDIHTPKPGDAAYRFIDYDTESNRKLVFKSWKSTPFLKDTPEVFLNEVAEFPARFKYKALTEE